MKIYLIAALFLGALVVAHSLEEEEKVELPEVPEQPEQSDEALDDAPAEDAEDEDNDEDKRGVRRKRRDRLSRLSCRRLYNWGYCRRYALVRNILCWYTCHSCKDKLSRVSCLRIRSYKKCKSLVGRLYCKKTCRRCHYRG